MTEALPASEKTSVPADADPVLQYVVVRNDLGWPLGAMCAQAAHAAIAGVTRGLRSDDAAMRGLAEQYLAPSNIAHMRKCVLAAPDESSLLGLAASLHNKDIPHHLWLEMPEKVPSALATAPMRKSVLAPFFKKLRLLK